MTFPMDRYYFFKLIELEIILLVLFIDTKNKFTAARLSRIIDDRGFISSRRRDNRTKSIFN